MTKTRKCTILLIAAVLLGGIHPVAAENIKIGIVEPEGAAQRYKPLVDHLNSGEDHVEIIFYKSIDDLYVDFSAKKVRLAMVGSVFYAKARAELGVIPLIKDRPNVCTIVVPQKSGIQSIDDLRGKHLSFGYPDSTTSNLIPRMVLWQHKIQRADLTDDPSAFKKDPSKILFSYSGGHQKVIETVLGGKADAGAVVDAIYLHNKDRGLRAIHTSEPYPGVPLICHKDETSQFRTRVQSLFLNFKPIDNGHTYHFNRGANPTSDADYDPVRYLCNIVLGTDYKIN